MSIDIHIPGFELIEEIGAGGMAKVYLAMQTMLERKVAIKILHQNLSSESDEFKKRFFYEGKVLAKLQNDNIVSIIDIGEADGLLYMAMEYVEGGTLADLLKKKQLTVDQAIQICTKIGLALHATHMKNIVHRDLKPSNILLRDIHTPLLTDFGIARQTDIEQGLTQTGHIVGTLQYMSPEQIRGMQVDHRSDIYSLGLMFYRLLVGRLPFVATGHYELSRMQCEEPPPPLPPELSGLQGVMDAMLAKDPADRFDSCLDFCKAVQNVSLTDENYATELTQATRIFDARDLSGSSFVSRRHSGSRSQPYSERYSDRYSDRHSETHSGQYTGSGSTRTSGQYDQQRSMDGRGEQADKGKTAKIALLGGIAAVVLALGSYFAFFFESGPDIPVLHEDDLRRMTSILRRVNSYIDDRQLDEASKRLEDAKEIATDHPDVQNTAKALASQYELDVLDLIDAGDMDGALQAIRKGLAVVPEFPALVKSEQEIMLQIGQQETLKIIAEALQLADGYESQDALIAPAGANAREQYDKVISLDEFNQTALAGLSSIEARLAVQIRATVTDGDLASAQQLLEDVSQFYPGSSVFSDIRQGIIEIQQAESERLKLTKLLTNANESVAAGRLLEPESDSALFYFNQVLNLDRNNPDARLGLDNIAAKFLGDANQAITGRNFEVALQMASNGLRAQRDNQELLTVQKMATSELGELEQQVQNTLQRATGLVQAVRDAQTTEIRVADEVHENLGAALLEAKSGFEKVLDLRPDNADAQRGLASLASVLYNGLVKIQRSGKYDLAKSTLASAGAIPASQDRFTQLSDSLDKQIQQRDRQERVRELVQLAESAIAVRPMTNDTIDQAAAALADVRSEFPNDASLSTLVRNLTSAVASEASSASRQGSDAAGLLMLENALRHFAGNPVLVASQADIRQTQRQREEEELRRIVAISGQLAIDAMPWGVVKEIRNQDGNLVPLDGEAQTPFVRTLLEGSYTVLIRSDSGIESTRQVNVVRQQLVLIRADYELISADEYFEKSGW